MTEIKANVVDLKQNRRHQIPSLSACRMLAAAVLEPSVPTHLSVLTTASTSGMLALWEIALSSLSSWLFNRRYLFLKQDNWGAGEKNVMNPSEWQANMQFYGMQCHRPLRAAEQGTQFSPLHLSQPFALPASTTAHSHSKPTSCCFLSGPSQLSAPSSPEMPVLCCSSSDGVFQIFASRWLLKISATV